MAPNSRDRRRVGLARALSKLGYCSRSQPQSYSRRTRAVERHDSAKSRHARSIGADRIDVDDEPVKSERKIYLVLNKPRGIVTTAADEKGRDTVYACLPPESSWVGPVGRLDKASEGLLLLTNDSEWAARASAPETHLDKTYHVQVAGIVDDASLQALTNGIRSENGELLRAKTAHTLRKGQRNTWLEITLDEGKTARFAGCSKAKDCQCCGWCAFRSARWRWERYRKRSCRNLTQEEKQALDAAMKSKNPR